MCNTGGWRLSTLTVLWLGPGFPVPDHPELMEVRKAEEVKVLLEAMLLGAIALEDTGTDVWFVNLLQKNQLLVLLILCIMF